MEKYYTLPEAAKILRMPETTFRQHRPEIGGSKLGRRWIFSESEIQKFIEKNRSKPISELKS